MIERFFIGKTDPELDKRGKIESGDMYISKWEFSGKATWDDTLEEFTLDTSATINDDDFNSVMKNLQVVDDDGFVAMVKIDDTVGSTKKISIVKAALLLEKDGTTPATLTDTNTYNVVILTPTTAAYDRSGIYGCFAGYVELSYNIVPEYIKMEYGVPSSTKWKDRVGSAVELTGSSKMVTQADTMEAFLNAVLYGKQTGQISYGIASNPGVQPYYRIVMVGADKEGLLGADYWHKTQFEPNGEVAYFSKEYKTIPFKGDVLTHGFYPADKADYAMMIR